MDPLCNISSSTWRDAPSLRQPLVLFTVSVHVYNCTRFQIHLFLQQWFRLFFCSGCRFFTSFDFWTPPILLQYFLCVLPRTLYAVETDCFAAFSPDYQINRQRLKTDITGWNAAVAFSRTEARLAWPSNAGNNVQIDPPIYRRTFAWEGVSSCEHFTRGRTLRFTASRFLPSHVLSFTGGILSLPRFALWAGLGSSGVSFQNLLSLGLCQSSTMRAHLAEASQLVTVPSFSHELSMCPSLPVTF